jgi:phosphate transport system permease protein
MTTQLERPANAMPWARVSNSTRLIVILASVLPAVATYLFSLQSDWGGAALLVAVFLPLQLLFAAIAAAITRGARGIADSILTVTVYFSIILVMTLLGSVVVSLFKNGAQAMSWHFLVWDSRYVTTSTSLDYGGVGHAVVGTLIVVLLATLMAIPFALATAIYLTETRGRLRGPVRFIVQSMSGLPSIVSGLFIYAMLILSGISNRSGFMAALALALLMLPTVARMSEEVLKLVPSELRNAAVALGAPRRAAFFQVTFPAARTGLVTALLLGLARIMGETAPLLMTTFRTDVTNLNPFSGDMTLLPTYINAFVLDPHDTSQHRAWGAALVLFLLVGIIFISTRVLTGSIKLRRK